MTFKEFATGVFLLPARTFSFFTGLLLGSYDKDKYGQIKTDFEGNPVKTRGLFGLALDAVKYIGLSVSNFISNHKQAIAVAFWSSLVTAGAAALTVALWPAALAAVVGFSVYGVSIASLVGTGFAAQVAATAGVAAALTSAAVYVGATVVNAFNGIRSFFAGRKAAASNASEFDATEEEGFEVSGPSNVSTAFSTMAPSKGKSSSSEEVAPVKPAVVVEEPKQTAPLFTAVPVETVVPVVPVVAPEEVVATTATMK